MNLPDILTFFILLSLPLHLSIGAVVTSEDVSTLTITIIEDPLDPLLGTGRDSPTATTISPIFTGATETQSLPTSSTTSERLPSSMITSFYSLTSIFASPTMTSSPTSTTTSTSTSPSPSPSTTLARGDSGDSGNSTKSITNAGIIGLSAGLAVILALACIAFWIIRRPKKVDAKSAAIAALHTHSGKSSTDGPGSATQHSWDGDHGWPNSKETGAQVTQMTEWGRPFPRRLDSLRKGPYGTTNLGDMGYWTSTRPSTSRSRPPASCSRPQIGQQTPCFSDSETLREQTDLAMHDLETELDTINRSVTSRGHRKHKAEAPSPRRISPADRAIQKFNDLHNAYKLNPLSTGRNKSLPDLPIEQPASPPQAAPDHDDSLDMVATAEMKPTIDFGIVRNRTYTLNQLEGRYASSSEYSQDSAGENPTNGQGIKTWVSLPNLWRDM